ncbi:MAG: hypothetical protein LBD49_01920 [Oscillospiraceae bacterium]|nr:hypothetical protein [Oscillospiraceae bacterium]
MLFSCHRPLAARRFVKMHNGENYLSPATLFRQTQGVVRRVFPLLWVLNPFEISNEGDFLKSDFLLWQKIFSFFSCFFSVLAVLLGYLNTTAKD